VLVLTVIQGPDKGRTFQLPDQEPQLVGRSSEALPLTDATVSRRHAELTPDRNAWYIRDLGSQNGTWVNGTRITARTRLKPGDQIKTGATLMVFGLAGRQPELDTVRIIKDSVKPTVDRALASSEDSVMLGDSVSLGESDARTSAGDHLRVVYQLTTLTSQLPDRQRLLEGVMDLVFQEFRPERGVMLLISEAGQPEPAVVRFAPPPQGLSGGTSALSGVPGDSGLLAPPGDKPGHEGEPARRERINVSRTILQHCLSRNEGVLSTNAMTDPRFTGAGINDRASPADSITRLAIRSAICSPIRFRDRTFGAIYIDSSGDGPAFTPEQLALMNAVGQHTGLALANAELYAQKLQAERLAAMGETVASLSHSIKNILQGLRGGADVVEMGLKKEDLKVSRGGWGILKRNLDRIIGLTMNMLAYSRPRTLEIELTRLTPLLEDCASLLKDLCDARGVVLIVDADPDFPPVPIDTEQMHQAFMNLFTNAVEAVEPRAGVVTVKAGLRVGPEGSPSGGEVRVDVIDNGPGVPPAMQRKIFEPFVTTKGLRGTGLGLAVTRRIVEQHRGRVEVRSPVGNGRGACFSVILPVSGGIDPSQTADAQAKDRRPPI
jgi:signal transduction histidine kinase/pSer/pThr/pTyr-binding forkhead associated (FHA) protein